MARSASRVECRSTQRDLFTAHPIDYPPPKRVGPSPPTSKDNTLYIERHHSASTPQLPSPSSLSHHHHHQRSAAAEPPRMQSMSASAYVAYPPAPASPPPQRAPRHSAPFSPMMSASREAYQSWPQQPRGQSSFQSVTLPPAPTSSE